MAADLKPGTYADRDPDRLAVIEHATGRTLTYRELEDRSARLAGLWRQRGIGRGDHVAVLLENQAEYFVVAWAAQRAGVYLTPVNWHLGADEAGYIIGDCGARAVVSTARLGALLADMRAVTDGVPVRLAVDGDVDGWDAFDAAVDAAPPIDPADEREGTWMFYSSGTTGRPKGIKPPQRDEPFGTGIQFDAMLTMLFGFREDMRYLVPAPMYHAAPLGWSIGCQRQGGTVVLLDRFDAAGTLRAIEQHRVTHVQFVPTHFVRMLKLDPAVRASADLSSLEVVVHAAAPCPPDVKEAMLDWLGPIVWEYYSGSEGAGFCMIGPDEWRAHRGSVGRSLLGTPHVVGPDGEELGVGETGQLWFDAAQPFEYHGDPAKTKEAVNDRGWATIGDIGHVDAEGYVFLTDRVSHTVISGGVNIYPREIEDVLVVHPEVLDVAVIGVPDDEMGERLLAIVEPAPGVEGGDDLAEELRRHCRDRLAGYKVPREVVFVAELPRLPTGKVRKSELRRQYGTWSGAVTDVADR
jgi:acyl-CoA synthetase (AMP-forming)/AMP-acid ligase II